jgi:hypothetical protein
MELRTVRASRRVVFGAWHAVWSLRIDARTNRSIFLSDMGASMRFVRAIDGLQRAPAVCRRFHEALYALHHGRMAQALLSPFAHWGVGSLNGYRTVRANSATPIVDPLNDDAFVKRFERHVRRLLMDWARTVTA